MSYSISYNDELATVTKERREQGLTPDRDVLD